MEAPLSSQTIIKTKSLQLIKLLWPNDPNGGLRNLRTKANRLPRQSGARFALISAIAISAMMPVSQAFAGHYTLTSQSGGVATVTMSSGQVYNFPYSSGSQGYGENKNTDASISFAGAITTTFTWVPDFPGDVPPDNAVITETCRAAWSGWGPGGPNGTANNGLGFDQVVTTGGSGPIPGTTIRSGASDGRRYTVRAGENTITVVCSPSVSSSVGGAPNCFLNALVRYNVSCDAVLVRLSGVVGEMWRPKVLIGQGVTANLISPLTPSSYSWTIGGGNPFKNYYVTPDGSTPDTSTYVPLSGTDLSQASPHWYFGKAELGGYVTISCNAHLPVPAGSLPAGGLDVTAHIDCTVDKPDNTLSVYMGTTQLVSPTEMHLWGATYGNVTWGTLWVGSVTTPFAYQSWGFDPGGWNYTSLTFPGRTRTIGGVTQPWCWNGYNGLDTRFGYAPPRPDLYPDDGMEMVEGDAPSTPLYSDLGATSVTVNESFQSYTLYLPPGTVSPDRKLVALKNWNWYWAGAANMIGGSWQLSNAAAQWEFWEDFPIQPQWLRRIYYVEIWGAPPP